MIKKNDPLWKQESLNIMLNRNNKQKEKMNWKVEVVSVSIFYSEE